MTDLINKGTITTSFGTYERYAVTTHFIKAGESYIDIFSKYVIPFVDKGDIVICSEKIIALCQNRIIKKSEMHLSLLAKLLSKFASHPIGGVGVGEPYKMQFAIDKTSIYKVLYASIAAAIGKLFGKKGVFYEIVGPEISGLDGFYGNVWKEYGDIGILLPENPTQVCEEFKLHFNVKCVIVDANDWGQVVLGKSVLLDLTNEQIIEIIKDNPAGQGRECTPFIIARKIE